MEHRKAVLFAILLALPAMAGCNVRDWYNQEGWVVVNLAVDPGKNSSIDNFRSLKAAIYGVDMRQQASTDTKHFSFGSQPLIVDLVEKAKDGEAIKLAEFRTNLRATDRVAIRLVVFEAIPASGTSMEVCRLNTRPERYPCFFQPDNGALFYDAKSFSPPRGGQVEVGFPVGVGYATKGNVAEYFLFADPGLVTLDVKR